MPRPPSLIFQKARLKLIETKKIIKKNYVKYFLIIYLFSELISFGINEINHMFYYEFVFNFMMQIQLFFLFLFLLKFNFCQRNKIIIYCLLLYFLINAFLPFFVTNEFYLTIMKNILVILLSALLILTLTKK
jgi:hypothetical protein